MPTLELHRTSYVYKGMYNAGYLMADRSLAAVRKRTKATRGMTSNREGTEKLRRVILAVIATERDTAKTNLSFCWVYRDGRSH